MNYSNTTWVYVLAILWAVSGLVTSSFFISFARVAKSKGEPSNLSLKNDCLLVLVLAIGGGPIFWFTLAYLNFQHRRWQKKNSRPRSSNVLEY